MRYWAALVTVAYAAIVVLLLLPLAALLGGEDGSFPALILDSLEIFTDSDGWPLWIWIVALVGGEASLILLAVDSSRRRLRPRQRIAFSIVGVSLAIGVLTGAAIISVLAAIWGDESLEFWYIGLLPWVIWGGVFYLHRRNISAHLDRSLGWLAKGSVLELLIVVPCHVIVRQRDDCCAPAATGLAIAAGIAIMLMAFGPGIVLLYQKRLAEYGERRRPEG